jgi:hypothetical protein
MRHLAKNLNDSRISQFKTQLRVNSSIVMRMFITLGRSRLIVDLSKKKRFC